jgi:hypothetical protein
MEEQERDELMAKLREQYAGRVAFFEFDGYPLVAVAPPKDTEGAFKGFFDGVNTPGQSPTTAYTDFALKCIVYPERRSVVADNGQTFDVPSDDAVQLVSDYPEDAFDLVNAVREILGSEIKQGTGQPEEIKALRATHKKLAWWDVPGHGLLIASRPKHTQRYNDMADAMIDNAASKYDAQKEFALACVVNPDRPQAQAIFRDFPALYADVTRACRDFCSGSAKRLGKA